MLASASLEWPQKECALPSNPCASAKLGLSSTACAGHLGDARSAAALVKDLKAALPTISAAWVEKTAPYVLAEDRKRLIEGLARAGVFPA